MLHISMITRKHGNLRLRNGPAPLESRSLEERGYAILENILAPEEIAALAVEINAVFDESEIDCPRDANNEWRHGMLNRSPLSQRTIGHPRMLEVIEPLLGEDCHVIANTAWRNVHGHQGGPWHIDAGPHVPRPEGVAWPEAIPYPVFAIGAHFYLEDCPMECGPTAVLPGSHKSGRPPPVDRIQDLALTYDGQSAHFLTAKAGDVALFVSDVWHRGTPAADGQRRFFLQAHYGRRDIAQRILTTDEVNHLAPETVARAEGERGRQLIGLHKAGFYDG